MRDLTVTQALARLMEAFERGLLVDHRTVIVSTNVPTRRDGAPYSGVRDPDDPGVAVYFTLGTRQRCLACDRYRTVAGNIAAVAAHFEALRAIDRYGVGSLEQAFAGYSALPERATGAGWADVLGVSLESATFDECREAFKRLALERHPDRPTGSHEAMVRLTEALRDAEAWFRSSQVVS